MTTRLNNYSPRTGNRHDFCGITLGAEEWGVLKKHGFREGQAIRARGDIKGDKISLRLQADDAGDKIRAGNRDRDIYWFRVDRNDIILDGQRPLSDLDDLYMGPLEIAETADGLRLISTDETVRKSNRKRNTGEEAEVDEGDDTADATDEIRQMVEDCKARIAKRMRIDVSKVELRLSITI